MNHVALVVLLPPTALITACGPAFPLDDVLRLGDVQVVGTHNSYHVQTSDAGVWAYDHEPLDVQIRELGVRQFELDGYWNDELERWDVLHVPTLDAGTTCESLSDCVAAQASALQQDDLPIVTLIELKTGAREPQAQLDSVQADLLAHFEPDQLVYPAELLGGSATLADAVAADGWPTLGELRGRTSYVLHSGDTWRGHLTTDDSALGDRALFAEAGGDLTCTMCAYQVVNDPTSPQIANALAAGQLVRTRADADSVQARENDPTQRDAAFASGANAVSTDWPAAHPDTGYVVALPEGRSGRCNPATAPAECTDDAVSLAAE
ncbi:MAG: Ca2+-dependent phosphoinositide-specific phospholipase C [Myxococcota bacterium]